jgi:hypothetical protein
VPSDILRWSREVPYRKEIEIQDRQIREEK